VASTTANAGPRSNVPGSAALRFATGRTIAGV
jgi:hypothetical protein